jgi:hypothetical protein
MSIPNFKSQDDWQEYLNIFDDVFQYKKAMLDRVREELFPGYRWDTLPPKSIETINDIVSNLVYEVERQFKETHETYEDLDDFFIPMNLTNRQIALLQVALTNFYDEIAKTSTSQMKTEVMELSQIVQDYSMEKNK